jgi:hypothetical protein
MGTFDDVGQKIKGKVQQVQGEFNQQRGKGVKGGVQKLKGKANVTIADAKLKSRDDARDYEIDDDDDF